MAVGAAAAVVGIGFARGDDAVNGVHDIRILSSRPDMITRGDALVGVTAAPQPVLSGLRISLDGLDMTSSTMPLDNLGVHTGCRP